ncbi:sigma-54-dependent transcriptional regulator [Desulfofustis limnaeus]|jgi:two-component system NtrC family response regulator|uniref:Acetoacetate metabolism regulatory protein AtoC n=1 Tax=Desulfofustis limnaeus TaxID=2740163 RepID=A0ABN6M6K7_9BACT|nr:sigma-54 dependent transcriptional regulator [Desulfofustis limnaeus]MDX9894556.1 sigma-54 dependent transcriptional regulator [Desulfofustis sp.]BDD87062.1 acetoacetate metabolism regulatory protein AtoC [Desulfofustis limnaeus]
MTMHTILVVDDEPNYLIVLSELLRDEGFEVLTAPGGEEALATVKEADLDVVLTDMQMPGMDGMTLLGEIKKSYSDLPVVIITAYAEIDKAVAAMQAGAYSYLAKPFSNDELIVTIGNAVSHYSLIRENTRLRREMQQRDGFSGLVGKNPKMRQIYELIEKVAPTPASVLISGESGTGKELVAKAIHLHSPREAKPFITFNCGALDENLLEIELFGQEKGGFTGAAALRKGRLEQAHQGTLFLDEIGDIPLSLQTKLLRVLQDRSFERVGGNRTLQVDVRILSATVKDLKEEVQQGRFREDLFYRLNVIHLALPPLRERMDDIPLLVDSFLQRFAVKLGYERLEIAPEALRLLINLPWEGNVRELENTIERAAILCGGELIKPEDVQPESITVDRDAQWTREIDILRLIPDSVQLNDVLYAVEEQLLNRALEEAGQVQARAAERLGITKSLLQYKMKKYGIKKQK